MVEENKSRWLLRIAPFAAYFFARYFLIRWYNYSQTQYYILAAGFFLLLPFSWAGSDIRRYLPLKPGRLHLTLILAIVLFLLPWAEWLQLGFLANRQEWSLVWLNSIFFVYCCFFISNLLPSIARLFVRFIETIAHVMNVRVASLIFPAVLFVLASSLCLIDSGGISHIQDGIAYLFQGKTFASGRLTAPAPHYPEFFKDPGDMMWIRNGKWFSIFPPGYSLLLAIGWMIDLPWAITPLLSAGSLWLLMSFLAKRTGNSTAVLFGLLFLLSPFVLTLSAEFMAHIPALASVSLALFSISNLLERKNVAFHSLLLAIALIAGALIRIFTTWLFLLPFLCYYLWNEVHTRRYRSLLAPAAGAAAGLILLLAYQQQTTGNAFVSAYSLQRPGYHYGFGPTLLHQTHTPLLGLENTSNHLNSFNQYLTGWPCGAFFFPLIFLFLAPKIGLWEKLFLLGSLMILTFYFFFIGIDLSLGPRMIFLITPAALLLNVRGIQMAWQSSFFKNEFISVLLVGSFAGYLFIAIPHLVSGSGAYGNTLLQTEVRKHTKEDMLIFVTDDSRYADDLAFNSPILNGKLIVARDLGDANARLMREYPSHSVFFFRRGGPPAGGFSLGNRFGLFRDRGRRSFQQISYFNLLGVIRDTNELYMPDIFDTCPTTVLNYDCASVERFLDESHSRMLNIPRAGYRMEFHQAFDTLTRLLTLPQCAYLRGHENWMKTFNCEQFRRLFYDSKNAFSKNPDLGEDIRRALMKVELRIDRNNDHILSDQEILNFVAPKVKEFRRFSFD